LWAVRALQLLLLPLLLSPEKEEILKALLHLLQLEEAALQQAVLLTVAGLLLPL
jgi:hypothetical protein